MTQMIRKRIKSADFKARHQINEKAFSRKRFFKFDLVCLMLLQKTLKSIQLHIHSLARQLELLEGAPVESVTAGAWTRARAKLKHSAFIELNEELLVKEFYETGLVTRFQGRRLLAIDGSVITLPSSEKIFKHFGQETATNKTPGFSAAYAQGQCCILYDLLNNLSIKTVFGPYRTGEMAQAALLCASLQPGDIVVADRGFASAALIACIRARGADCIIRLPNNSFKESQALFTSETAGKSILSKITARKNVIGQKPGEVIPIRFVSLTIPATGEREVLATTLLDEEEFPTELFQGIYNQRWGIETYIHQLKNRLDLENFSGKTVESIYQDFHAMLFISNYETILTRPAQEALDATGKAQEATASENHKKQADKGLPEEGALGTISPTKKTNRQSLPKKINHSVTYHLIKDHAIELFFSKLPAGKLVEKLTKLFQQNPHYRRKRPPTPQNNTSAVASARFRKTVRKITF